MRQRKPTIEAVKSAMRACSSSRRQTARCIAAEDHFSLIGGAVFSAGAGGNAGWAPSCRALASGLAGWGAVVVGRASPGLEPAGAVEFAGAGVPCNGGV